MADRFGSKLKYFSIPAPEDALKKLGSAAFGAKENSPVPVLITTLVVSFLCYFYHMLYGLGCPDTLCEGVWYYRNSDYSTSQARWMIRYINELFGKNIIIPAVNVLAYCFMIGISVYIICRMAGIKKPLHQISLTAMMVSFPIVLHHFAFMYMALAFSFSFMAVTVGCALVRTRKVIGVILGTASFLMMMGAYQAYIGAISALAIILLIFDVLNDNKIKNGLINFVLTGISGAAACIINIPFSSWMMKIHGVGADGRVSSFSIGDIFANLGFSLKYSYVWFFSYFNNDVLSRNRLYTVLLAVIALLCVISLIILIKEKRIAGAAIFAISILLIPIAMNSLLVIMPTNGMRDILRYQYALIFALLFILFNFVKENKIAACAKYLAYLAILFVFIGNVISANCTEFMYRICYDHTEQQMLLALERVYALEGYTDNQTRIVIGGAPSYEVISAANPKLFRYAEKDGGPVFWWNPYGMTICREHYFKDFLGVNAGYVSEQEYLNIVNSKQYAEMSVWPEEGSVEMIEGFAVIKFAVDPPKN